jgi:hypothetical protein
MFVAVATKLIISIADVSAMSARRAWRFASLDFSNSTGEGIDEVDDVATTRRR